MEVDGIEDHAPDVMQRLLVRAVADADRTGALVAVQVVEHVLIELAAAVDAVDDLQVTAVAFDQVAEEREVVTGLPLEAEGVQAPQRERRVALWGLYTLGFEWEANDYVAFLRDLVERDRGDLQIVYGIDGRRELDEHVLPHLNGYQGARPVRIGNGAYQQAQHDVWGVILDSIYLHTKSRDRLDDRTWKMACQQVERALERWREPDRGSWEVRGEPKHFTSSKMMCWVAADRGARLATLRDDKQLARTWRKAADEIHADICANALDDRGVFCQHYGTTALDASLLLMPLLRFLPRDDERIRATVLAIADELTEDGLVLCLDVMLFV